MSGQEGGADSPRCTPETLAALRVMIDQAIPSPLTDREVASLLLRNPWVRGMARICSRQRLRRARRNGRQGLPEFEDLVQEALLLVRRRCERRRAHGFNLARSGHLSGFWRVVIGHATTDAVKRLTRRPHATLPRQLPAREDQEMNERQRAVRDAVRQLSDRRQQAILALRLDEDLTFEEVGARLGLSSKSVRRSYLAALKDLRRLLGG